MEIQYKKCVMHLRPTELKLVDEALLIMFYKMNNLEDRIEDCVRDGDTGIVSDLWDDNILNTAVEIRDDILGVLEGRLGYHSMEEFYYSGEITYYNRKGTPLTCLAEND